MALSQTFTGPYLRDYRYDVELGVTNCNGFTAADSFDEDGLVHFRGWKLRGDEGETCFMFVRVYGETDEAANIIMEPVTCEVTLTGCGDGYHTKRDGKGFQYCVEGM